MSANSTSWSRPAREVVNAATMVLRRRLTEPEPRSFRRLFIDHYTTLRELCTGFPHPGVAIAAFEAVTGRFRGSLCAAHEGSLRSIIVGRHEQADLLLERDPTLSLRHLAVLFGPAEEDGRISVRVLDLRTQAAFEDEHGRRHASLVTDGPLMLRCGGHALLLLMTGPSIIWPEDAVEAWSRLPPRVFLDDEPAPSPRAPAPAPGNDVTLCMRRSAPYGHTTLVRRRLGPLVMAPRHCLLAPDEDPLGTLVVTGPGGTRALVVGEQAMARGVLVGRYSRCDLDAGARLYDQSVSRVHLLLLALGRTLYAIDTASRNGTLRGGQPMALRIAPLRPGDELQLGSGPSRVRWESA